VSTLFGYPYITMWPSEINIPMGRAFHMGKYAGSPHAFLAASLLFCSTHGWKFDYTMYSRSPAKIHGVDYTVTSLTKAYVVSFPDLSNTGSNPCWGWLGRSGNEASALCTLAYQS